MQGPVPASARSQAQSHAPRDKAWRDAKRDGAADAVDSLGQKGMRRSGRENPNDAVRREARNASSVAAARQERQAALACRGLGKPRSSSDSALCIAEKTIVVAGASRDANACHRTPANREPVPFRLACVALRISKRLAEHTSAPRLDWSRFADATAGDGPNDAMKPPQTGAGEVGDRHAAVMKPSDRRFRRPRRPTYEMLRRNIIAILSLNNISAYL